MLGLCPSGSSIWAICVNAFSLLLSDPSPSVAVFSPLLRICGHLR